MSETFDPTKHLRQLRGRGGTADYLDVKWRLVWLRSEHPDAITEVEHVEISPDVAIFKAQVMIPGQGRAVDYGSETPKDFGDYIEKAATKALGRALAQLGYGTQFVGFELDENTRIVDSPVQRDDDGHSASQPPPPRQQRQAPPQQAPAPTPAANTDDLLLLAIRDDFDEPDARKKALHQYYTRAQTPAELNQRVEQVKLSGIPKDDLQKAYAWHHSRIAQQLAPAGYSG